MISNQEKKKKKKARLLHHIGELHSHSRIRLPKKWNFCLLINKWASQTSAASCGCPVHDSLLGNAVKFSIWDAVLGTRIWVGVLCAFGSQDITLANSLGSFFSSLFFLLLESNCFIILCWPLSLYHFFKVDWKRGVTPAAAVNSVFSIMRTCDSLPAAQRRRLVSGGTWASALSGEGSCVPGHENKGALGQESSFLSGKEVTFLYLQERNLCTQLTEPR